LQPFPLSEQFSQVTLNVHSSVGVCLSLEDLCVARVQCPGKFQGSRNSNGENGD